MLVYVLMMFVDAILTLVSIILGMMLRLEILYSGYSLFGYFLKEIWPFIIFCVFLRPVVFYFTGIYKHIWRYATWRDF